MTQLWANLENTRILSNVLRNNTATQILHHVKIFKSMCTVCEQIKGLKMQFGFLDFAFEISSK